MQEIDFVFAIAVLIMSVVAHEFSHGYAADMLGDPTARYAGRLTLNPLKHLDFLGSFVIPVITYLAGGFIFGWAKPVPYNPYNLKSRRWGPAIVGLSGPAANFLIAAVFGLLIRYSSAYAALPQSLADIFIMIVFVNVILGVFNLIPIHPLDGSKLLFAVIPYKWRHIQDFIERWGFFILIFFIFTFFRFLYPIIGGIFKLLTGIGL